MATPYNTYDSHTVQEALLALQRSTFRENRLKFLTFVARKVLCEMNGRSRGEMLSNKQTADPTVTLDAHACRGLTSTISHPWSVCIIAY